MTTDTRTATAGQAVPAPAVSMMGIEQLTNLSGKGAGYGIVGAQGARATITAATANGDGTVTVLATVTDVYGRPVPHTVTGLFTGARTAIAPAQLGDPWAIVFACSGDQISVKPPMQTPAARSARRWKGPLALVVASMLAGSLATFAAQGATGICRTEDSPGCVWFGPIQGSNWGPIIVNPSGDR